MKKLRKLPGRKDGKAVAFKVGDQLCGVPAVNTDLQDVELLAQLIDGLPHEVVVHDIAFRNVKQALLLPDVVWHMIAPDAQVQRFPGKPEVRKDDIMPVDASTSRIMVSAM